MSELNDIFEQPEANELKTVLLEAIEEGDNPETIMASMMLTTSLFKKGITIQQFEDNYELYEKLCIDSNYSVDIRNIDYIFYELKKVTR